MSSPDRVVRAGHGQLIATPITIAMIAGRDFGHLAVPVRRPFTLGTLRLELIPSGRTLGAAALHVDTGMRTVLYAGAIRTAHASEGAEVRASDAVVVSAPIGEPHHVLPPLAEVADRLVAWVRARLTAGTWPVLVVDTALDGLEVAAHVVAAGLPVIGAKSLRDAAVVVGAGAPAIRAPGKERAVLIRAESDRVKIASTVASETALVSVRAVDPQPGFQVTFAWPFVATRDQLLGWIEQARSKHVFVTGACADTIVAAVGARAQVLGPPQQMALFSS